MALWMLQVIFGLSKLNLEQLYCIDIFSNFVNIRFDDEKREMALLGTIHKLVLPFTWTMRV